VVVCAKCGRESPDDFGFCPFCGAPLRAAQPQQVRKFVSVLFCDLTGSTALGHRTDPEALRVMMRRYYDNARAVLEHHGGTVEKFVGDAVMAVFGIPVATEDDALRAVRAAVELRDAVQDLGLEARIGSTLARWSRSRAMPWSSVTRSTSRRDWSSRRLPQTCSWARRRESRA
jgi:Adenylate and Guanylate cyclase catalytic domain